ncbi:nascent polypeptide-associated complex subunit alpha, muscle-specific form-like [Cricetulus griseus]|uniref:Nascent polypeptide-associated complex subunit alpha, muscle-specific form-like n=1 Tax=Cricetulus griseus TaxID=10029 RepID=A0A9J7F0V2_CRIGR|nr:nascent polypeptide-associated complex subunit alpha, muscle-specific form-like [Cricetulus griseus]
MQKPRTGRKVTSPRRPVRACAGARRRPPEAAGPRSLRGAPRGPPPPPRPEVCELRSPTAHSQRGPQKSLSSPPAAPPVPRAESSGAAAFRPGPGLGEGAAGLGQRRGPERWAWAKGRAKGKFQDRGHQQRRSGLRRPDSQRRAEGSPRTLPGTRAPATPHQPPAQPVTRSVTRSAPRPPVARATVSADQPWTAPRAAPRLPAALPRRPPKSASSYPLACAPTDRRPRVPAAAAAAAPTPFLCCWTFGGGEGEREKLGAEARKGPSVIAELNQTAGPRPAVAAVSSARVWGPRPRRRSVCCCAASSREPHIPAQDAALRTRSARPPARPPDTPPRRPARAADTPPPRPRAWPLGAPRPSAQGLGADSGPG